MSDQPSKRDPFDGDYIGNIFGWRISIIGAVVMLLIGGLMAYRHLSMNIPLGWQDPDQEIIRLDTLTGHEGIDTIVPN
ncbi:MAG: hypothetical protein WBA17_08835 [Saprospiraceae bacterium]